MKDVCYVAQWVGSFIVTLTRPLIYRRPGNMNAPLVGTYSDSSHANAPNMSSHYGVAQEMCDAVVSWSAFSGWQTHASTRDAELLAAVKGLHGLLYERTLLIEAGLPHQFPLYIDNAPTVQGTQSDRIHLGSRHAAIRTGILRQAVREALCTCVYKDTKSMVADILKMS